MSIKMKITVKLKMEFENNKTEKNSLSSGLRT